MLHPDKNSSVGADGGFQLISEAKMMLLDNEKRAAYDGRMGYKGRPHPNEVPAYTDSQPAPPRPNQQKALCRTQKNVASTPPRPRQKNGPSASPQPSQHKAPGHTSGPSIKPRDTFWTSRLP